MCQKLQTSHAKQYSNKYEKHNMDVENSNRCDVGCRISLKNVVYESDAKQFSMETYFVWFSALIFLTELVTDICLVTYYIHQHELRWGLITFAIIILPLMLCQIYSLLMLKTQKNVGMSLLFVHLLLMGITYRYQSILRKVDKEKMTNQELENIKQKIREVNTLQTWNAVLQYLPQFIFQAFLIVYKKYKCVITGVSAGLAGFSFIWHIFIHFYYYIKRFSIDQNTDASNTRIIDNLTSSQRGSNRSCPSVNVGSSRQNFEKSNLSQNIKIFEKPMYKTDDKNLVSKKQSLKNVEKSKIFGFNKRKTVYETEEFDLYDYNNLSTVFFEVDDSACGNNKLNTSITSNKTEEFNNENNTNIILTKNLTSTLKHPDIDLKSKNIDNAEALLPENRILKRKGICSSQEMLHLVDIMNDDIPPEQVDMLAKSLVEMGGDESLKTDSDNTNNSKLLERFPDFIDEQLLENIETAIYENQVIFQERIRRNQLTIQNLKLQDQLLSKYMDEIKDLSPNEMIDIRDYENMCFANVNRHGRLKHWRNYLQDIDTNMHDNSTTQHSSFYVNTNTMSNSLTDLYVNETDVGSVLTEDGKLSDQISIPLPIDGIKKTVRWSEKLTKQNDENASFDSNMSDNLYINMTGLNSFLPRKNILVETINTINVESPVSHLLRKCKTSPNSIRKPSDK